MTTSTNPALVLALVFVVVGGCNGLSSGTRMRTLRRSDPVYEVELSNETSIDFPKADVRVGDWTMSGGKSGHNEGLFLAAHTSAIWGMLVHRVPDAATVSWQAGDGVLHEKQVRLQDVPKSFRGIIEFTIVSTGDVKVAINPN